ncbi:MAG TPA: hydrogenase 3 maturation endopeptidase HyCI, partial [Spirochaetes bacterium]|nr:hydrogenase 3 maturation endopeptidase HyCI [Spirochaetota bacterium]
KLMTDLNQNIKVRTFKEILKGKIVLFGIGNTLRGDDALGPMLVEMLREKVNAVCINAEGSPENFLGKVIKEDPDTLLIIDAVYLNAGPGEYRLLAPEELENAVFTTHDIPLTMLIDYLKSKKNMSIHILGIEPQHLYLGRKVSSKVKQTIILLKEMITNAAGTV